MQNFCIYSLGGTEKVKTLRKRLAVVILTLTLAVSAFAGQTQTPGALGGTTTPPPPDVIITLILTVVSIVP